jgi:hypothetical protein
MHSRPLKKMMWAFLLAVVMALFGCGPDHDDDGGPSSAVTEIKFLGGTDHPQEEKPVSTSTGNDPVITDFSYSKVVRQCGDFTGTVTFTDPDDYTGVTTLLIKIDQAEGFTEFEVVPVLDLLSGLPRIAFTIQLAENFTPGIFTFYLGVQDVDGNVSNYLHKVLIVKSLQDLAITSMTPLDGSTGVPLNTTVRVTFSQQVFSHETSFTLLEGSTPITGTSYMSGNGLVMTFIPDSFLLSDTAHRATITLTVNNKSLTHTFLTEDSVPLSSPADLVGKTFSISMDKDNLIEPEEGKAVFDVIPFLPTILMKVLSFSGDEFQNLSAAAEDDPAGGYKQSAGVPTFGPNPSNFTNPYFSAGPTEMIIDLGVLGLPGVIGVYGITVSGNFVETGGQITGFENGSFSAYLDSVEVNAIISIIAMGEVDVCEILPLCDKDGFIRVRAENVEGAWETGITYLYDMTCTSSPDSIEASTGGSLLVTCTVLEDGSGYLGDDITFLAQTGVLSGSTEVGTWNTTGYTCSGTPPTCAVPDGTGQISLTVTIGANELESGDESFRVGGSTISPAGEMTRTQSVQVD